MGNALIAICGFPLCTFTSPLIGTKNQHQVLSDKIGLPLISAVSSLLMLQLDDKTDDTHLLVLIMICPVIEHLQGCQIC